ncbi:hypothetical protein B0T18DRAFT_208492 [Schizothecium vesticola]|uniref:Uncharacterized protein n=1 Tax=Schizothecium vesticola TaxID=314040 RepID=A0AA40EJC6_9PEZI|nr:hypothetical protein B0T18DRAFT_208492 [Schizothecium vesticola]
MALTYLSHSSVREDVENTPEMKMLIVFPGPLLGHDAPSTHPATNAIACTAGNTALHRLPTPEQIHRRRETAEQVPAPEPYQPLSAFDPLPSPPDRPRQRQRHHQRKRLSRRQPASHQRSGAVRRPLSISRLPVGRETSPRTAPCVCAVHLSVSRPPCACLAGWGRGARRDVTCVRAWLGLVCLVPGPGVVWLAWYLGSCLAPGGGGLWSG